MVAERLWREKRSGESGEGPGFWPMTETWAPEEKTGCQVGRPPPRAGSTGCCSVAQSCPTLCNPMDCRLPGSSVPGILQARRLEWVAISFSITGKSITSTTFSLFASYIRLSTSYFETRCLACKVRISHFPSLLDSGKHFSERHLDILVPQ